jgi:predicted DsbA family dithiol-disulfide isomerase
VTRRIEVFADMCCPFTHSGLKRVAAQLADTDVELVVRAWPLEWVNGAPLEAEAVSAKIAVLENELDVDDFVGFREETWPASTIPALNLAAQAALVDEATGLRVSLALRAALFEQGLDIADPAVLADIAAAHGLSTPGTEPHPSVEADYADGQRRGVRGSPDFWVGENEFFCPALDLARDEAGALHAEFDRAGLERFIAAAIG